VKRLTGAHHAIRHSRSLAKLAVDPLPEFIDLGEVRSQQIRLLCR
jgi:hypothetical protein